MSEVGPSPFVIDDVTGEKVPVVQVEAVAAVSMASSVGQGAGDMPPDAGKRIEQAMAGAAANAIAAGISDPKTIRGEMLLARESVKQAMRTEWRDFLSQQAAAAAEAAAQEK